MDIANKVAVLDCTLRDGGYINGFDFGNKNIKKIIGKLGEASIDIIECGFIQHGVNDKEKTLFANVASVRDYIEEKKTGVTYVAMIQLGNIAIEEIEPYDGTSVDGIRLTFHEHEIEEAVEFGEKIKELGYLLFMQPVGTSTYSDAVLLELMQAMNRIKPYAFYMVDTLGNMYPNDLLRMYLNIDHNLNENISLGFHSHNNLQLSFANSQKLLELNTPRKIIIDSSVFGLGRGAGNLCTELIIRYINENIGKKYDEIPIIDIIDQYINPISKKYHWGYDIAYYIAAVAKCHPNYATYLLNRQTIRAKEISDILNSIQPENRTLYNEQYIALLYSRYLENIVDDSKTIEKFKKKLNGKKILLLAPGRSIELQKCVLNQAIQDKNTCVIAINFIPEQLRYDMLFVSNMKRFGEMGYIDKEKILGKDVIITSNIRHHMDFDVNVINYSSYINNEPYISDNAGMMCIEFLRKLGVNELMLAGFDGLCENQDNNYVSESLKIDMDEEMINRMNFEIAIRFKQLKKQLKIRFVTDSLYNKWDNYGRGKE